MDENGIRARPSIGFRTAQRLRHAAAGDQRLDPGDDGEIRIRLRVLARGDLARELIDIGELLPLTVQEAVGLRELLVFDAYAGDTALLELAHQAAQIVEIAVSRIAVEQDGQIARIGHELEHVDDLRPARLVVVAHAELRGDRKSGRPNALEAGLAHDARGQAVVRLHQEFELGTLQHGAQLFAAGYRAATALALQGRVV